MDVEFLSQGGQNSYLSNSIVSDVSQGQQYDVKLQTNDKLIDKSGKNEGISEETAKKAADKANEFLKDKNTHIEYEQDKTFKQVMIMKVIDNDTKQVVNEIPSKKFLEMIADFSAMSGLILNKKA